MDDTVELSSLPDNAIVVKAKMLLGIKNWEDPANRKPKARMVVMGNVLYNKHMAVIKDGALSDLWAPVATLSGVRVVEARAAAHKRRTTGIDLVAAYTQIPMGGDRPYYIIVPQLVFQIMTADDNVTSWTSGIVFSFVCFSDSHLVPTWFPGGNRVGTGRGPGGNQV